MNSGRDLLVASLSAHEPVGDNDSSVSLLVSGYGLPAG
jgi:hypothetical protein